MSFEVIVSGGFDDLRSGHLRFLEEASRLGEVTVLLWADGMLREQTGKEPRLSLAERAYLLNAVRYVTRVVPLEGSADPNRLPSSLGSRPAAWVDTEDQANAARERFCLSQGIEYRVLPAAKLAGFPEPTPAAPNSARKKVVVTGCYDWFHSGHVRFFEEVSAYGDVYAVVGHDENIRLLKGEGHPLFPQAERRYLVGSVKYVTQALISSGNGWLDADPEIHRLEPDIYAVNKDGDRGGKREYCAQLGIEYLVLERTPAPGLPARTSTGLRGF